MSSSGLWQPTEGASLSDPLLQPNGAASEFGPDLWDCEDVSELPEEKQEEVFAEMREKQRQQEEQKQREDYKGKTLDEWRKAAAAKRSCSEEPRKAAAAKSKRSKKRSFSMRPRQPARKKKKEAKEEKKEEDPTPEGGLITPEIQAEIDRLFDAIASSPPVKPENISMGPLSKDHVDLLTSSAAVQALRPTDAQDILHMPGPSQSSGSSSSSSSLSTSSVSSSSSSSSSSPSRLSLTALFENIVKDYFRPKVAKSRDEEEPQRQPPPGARERLNDNGKKAKLGVKKKSLQQVMMENRTPMQKLEASMMEAVNKWCPDLSDKRRREICDAAIEIVLRGKYSVHVAAKAAMAANQRMSVSTDTSSFSIMTTTLKGATAKAVQHIAVDPLVRYTNAKFAPGIEAVCTEMRRILGLRQGMEERRPEFATARGYCEYMEKLKILDDDVLQAESVPAAGLLLRWYSATSSATIPTLDELKSLPGCQLILRKLKYDNDGTAEGYQRNLLDAYGYGDV